jgi:DNA-binding HxlR family transcriptional regulator
MKTETQRNAILTGLYENGSTTVEECSKYIPNVGSKMYGPIEAAKLRAKELESKGLVKKTFSSTDYRKKIVSLTEEGKSKCQNLSTN